MENVYFIPEYHQAKRGIHDLPGADPWLVMPWCLLITWLLAAMQPKSSTESIRREQTLGNLDGEKNVEMPCVLNLIYIYHTAAYFWTAYPMSGISMVSESSTWIRRTSPTSSSSFGVNSSKPPTHRPGGTTSAELDDVNLNTCTKRNRKEDGETMQRPNVENSETFKDILKI